MFLSKHVEYLHFTGFFSIFVLDGHLENRSMKKYIHLNCFSVSHVFDLSKWIMLSFQWAFCRNAVVTKKPNIPAKMIGGIKGHKMISPNWKSNEYLYGSLNNPPTSYCYSKSSAKKKSLPYLHSKLCNFLESPFEANVQDFNLDFISLAVFHDCE